MNRRQAIATMFASAAAPLMPEPASPSDIRMQIAKAFSVPPDSLPQVPILWTHVDSWHFKETELKKALDGISSKLRAIR